MFKKHLKYFFVLIFIVLSNPSIAQKLKIQQNKKTSFVNQIDNYFTLLGKMKSTYLVTSDNGTIEKSDAKNGFILRPNKAGKVQISVLDKSGNLISKENFNVKEIEFDIDFYGLKTGIDDINVFLNHNHLQLLSKDLECLDLECLDFYWLLTYDIIHIKENEKYTITNFEKSRTLNQLKEKLKQLEKGDILIFKNIKLYFQDDEYLIPDKNVYVN